MAARSSAQSAREALARGNAAEAERLARAAIRDRLDVAAAEQVLGLVALGRGDAARAAEAFARALEADPGLAPVAVHLAEALRRAGRPAEAVTAGRRATELDPRSAAAWNNLGLALEATGAADEAEQALRKALAIDDRYAKARLNLGNLLQSRQRLGEAESELRAALAAKPDYPQAWNSLGAVLAARGRAADASAAYHRALAISPRYVKPLLNLGKLFLELERFAEGLECFEEAARRVPESGIDPLLLQAQALVRLGRAPEAVERLRRAERKAPDSAQPHFEQGAIHFARFAFDLALTCFERAVKRAPNDVAACANLAFSKAQVCDWSDWDGTVERLRESVSGALAAGRPSPLPPHSAVFFPFSAAEQLAIARRHAQTIATQTARHAPPGPGPVPSGSRASGRIRVGYLSMDFRNNALAHLARPLFTLHDRARFEVVACSFGPNDGSRYRKEIEAAADRFVELEKLSSFEMARRIRDLELDLLVDLAGFAGNARPEAVAARPAPRIALWFYPGGCGGVFHDALVGDAVVTPVADRDAYGERLLLLPHTFQLNDGARAALDAAPSRASLGLPESGAVFCGFNQFAKIEPGIFDVWMRLLQRTPGSVLWLLALVPLGRENLRREAEARGVDPERLVFAPLASRDEHLARLARADVMLDTRYCNAHTSAADALLAGVPIVTCPYPTLAGRVAASVLGAAGLEECVVPDLASYEELAHALASDRERSLALRAKLASAHESQPFFDPRRTVRAVEHAWERLVASDPRDREPIVVEET